MRCRLRGPNGNAVLELSDTASVADLRQSISDKTGLPSFTLKSGFPPQSLDLDQFAEDVTIADTGLKLNGEQITVAARDVAASLQQTLNSPPPSAPAPVSKPVPPAHNDRAAASSSLPTPPQSQQPLSQSSKDPAQDPPEVYVPSEGMTMVLRVMPDDNSCLFRAVATAVQSDSGDAAVTQLRYRVADYIAANPDTYDTAILGKEPSKYCAWIQQENSWGGYVELSILSQVLGVEICAITVDSGHVQKYNEGAPDRIIVVYSGIHYDTVAMSAEPSLGPELDVKQFRPDDDSLLVSAQELCAKLNTMGYMTNTSTFQIRCGDCGWMGTGEQDAVKHAEQTGHYNFGETG